jgi:hypothetical protein
MVILQTTALASSPSALNWPISRSHNYINFAGLLQQQLAVRVIKLPMLTKEQGDAIIILVAEPWCSG